MPKNVDYSVYQRKRKEKEKNTTKIYRRARKITIFAIIICFCATLLILDYFSDGYVLADFDEVNALNKTTYYCVQMGMYSDLETANYYANLIKLRGGGGFVLKDGNFRVLASVYKNSAEAESVITRLNNLGTTCSLYVLQTEEIFDVSLSHSDREKIQTISLCTDYAYQELYNLSNEIDVETVTNAEIKGRIQSILDSLEEYETLLLSTKSTKKAEIKSCLSAIKESITKLPLSPTSSSIRYAYIEILVSRMIR